MCVSISSHSQICHIKLFTLYSQLSDGDIQGYHDAYVPRMDEMYAFNMVGRTGVLSPYKTRSVR